MIVVELARRSVVRKAETGPQTRVLERNAYGLENGYIGIQDGKGRRPIRATARLKWAAPVGRSVLEDVCVFRASVDTAAARLSDIDLMSACSVWPFRAG